MISLDFQKCIASISVFMHIEDHSSSRKGRRIEGKSTTKGWTVVRYTWVSREISRCTSLLSSIQASLYWTALGSADHGDMHVMNLLESNKTYTENELIKIQKLIGRPHLVTSYLVLLMTWRNKSYFCDNINNRKVRVGPDLHSKSIICFVQVSETHDPCKNYMHMRKDNHPLRTSPRFFLCQEVSYRWLHVGMLHNRVCECYIGCFRL